MSDLVPEVDWRDIIAYAIVALRKRGFAPTWMLDIGAFEGEVSALLHANWPGAPLVLIEADPTQDRLLTNLAK